ncbi:prenylcysteine lyase [Lecanosticta acicola]|uniref:Prenylcysteine lyase n=1 Tax=Lecanosticta acicola TaxID=111012 RepID=A0AAI8Z4I9_9PEZI|nr:prenylcysteine lyase [Lecanosticta acicola]
MRLTSIFLPALSCWTSTTAADQQVILTQHQSQAKPLNVAIIGAGAAGSSTAYYLSKYGASSSLPLNITIFERNGFIGGRSTTVSAYNDTALPVELGASIFVSVNQILVEAVKEFNFSTNAFREASKKKIPGDEVAIWNGDKFVLSLNGYWWDLAKLFWRYGTAPVKTQSLMKKTLSKFMKLYEEPYFPFKSLTQAAQEVELLAVTAATGEQYMRENGIGGLFGKEVVQASTRVNYAQNLEYIHGLEAMVCMATDGAMAVEGGNWQIFDAMVRNSGANVKLDTVVGGIWPQNQGSYALNFSHPDGSGSGFELFDAVVLAAPYQFSQLKSLGLETNDDYPDEIPYVQLHVTLFTSPHLLSPNFFGLPSDKPAPQVILTTIPEGEPAKKGPKGVGSPGFFSISLLRTIMNPNTSAQEYLYKIFSPQEPTPGFLADLLGVTDLPGHDEDSINERDVTWIYRKVWDSYPYEYPRVTFEDVKLGENLWYTAGMDSFISTMETNALMGKNVAKLVVEEFDEREVTEETGKIEEPGVISYTREWLR